MRPYYLTHWIDPETGRYNRRWWVKATWVPMAFKRWVAINLQPIMNTPPWARCDDRQPTPGVYDPIRHARNLKGQY